MINKTLLSLLLVAVLVIAIVTTVAVYAESKNEGKDEGKDKKDKGKEGKEGDEDKFKFKFKSKSKSKEAKEHEHERKRSSSRIILTMVMFFNDDPDVDGKVLIVAKKVNDVGKFLLRSNINMVVHNPNKDVNYDNLYACFSNMNLGKMQLVEQSEEGAVVLKLVDMKKKKKELPSDATITIPSPVKIIEGEDCVNGVVRYTAS
jgi:hypothetical protein